MDLLNEVTIGPSNLVLKIENFSGGSEVEDIL
jgi:hypothetical protein